VSTTPEHAPAGIPNDTIEIEMGADVDRWFVRYHHGSLILTCYPADGPRERTFLSFATFEKIAAAVEELKPR
jgi:hypothetical protein